MRKYDSYKDSGVKWIGEIPSHWKVIPFKRVAKVKTNLVHPEDYLSYPQVSPDCIEKGSGKLIKYETVEKANVESDNHLFFKGQLLYSKIRPLLNKITIAPFDGLCSADMYPIETTMDTAFLKYMMLSDSFLESVRIVVRDRVKMPKINQEELSQTILLYPPLIEQLVIATYLDRKSAEIDEHISKVEREIELLKEYKQAEIARVVIHGLNPNAPTKPSGISWIGDIPAHWEAKRLASAFTENKSLNSDILYTEAYKFNYGALVRKDEDTSLTDDVLETYKKYTVIKPNDILINGLNLNYDFVSQRVAISYANGIITSAYLAITPRENINPAYYCYLLKSMDAKKLFHGMGTGIRLTLSFAELKKQQILFPPIGEQEEIVKYINYKTTEIDRLVVELTYQVEYLKEYKQRLIADVVTGKINVQPD